jgi:hypothetical protein
MQIDFRTIARLGILFFAAAPAAAEHDAPHTLFRPTPDDALRPLAADRPDATESPHTVDAGRAQLEIEIASYLRDRGGGARIEEWRFLGVNAKFGLTRRVDVQLVFDAFTEVETTANGARTIANGFGDVQLRVKGNLWGNDGGRTALAVLPYITFPTARDGLGAGDVEGGMVVPFAVSIGERFGIGTQVELAVVRNAAGDGYDLDVSHTIVLGVDLTERAGVFVELASTFAGDGGGWTGTANGGFTFQLDDNTMLDVGAEVGLDHDAPDLRVFAGVTRRF